VASYILLCNLTQAGVEALVKEPPEDGGAQQPGLDLPAHLAEAFQQAGGQVRNAFWTLGTHDVVALADCDSNAQLQAALLGIARYGYVRTTTLTVLEEGAAGDTLDEAGRVSGHLRGGELTGGHLRGGQGPSG